jgi:hypothetical protein
MGPAMGRGASRLSPGGLSHGSESQIGSSHEDDVTEGPVMSHGGSSHESRSVPSRTARWVPSRTAGPVSGSSQWVQSVGPVEGSKS